MASKRAIREEIGEILQESRVDDPRAGEALARRVEALIFWKASPYEARGIGDSGLSRSTLEQVARFPLPAPFGDWLYVYLMESPRRYSANSSEPNLGEWDLVVMRTDEDDFWNVWNALDFRFDRRTGRHIPPRYPKSPLLGEFLDEREGAEAAHQYLNEWDLDGFARVWIYYEGGNVVPASPPMSPNGVSSLDEYMLETITEALVELRATMPHVRNPRVLGVVQRMGQQVGVTYDYLREGDIDKLMRALSRVLELERQNDALLSSVRDPSFRKALNETLTETTRVMHYFREK